MAANTQPIYSRVADVQWIQTITAANTAKDGTGTVNTVFTADATNGGWAEKLVFRALGTNVATVARVFINNGSTNATAANNTLFKEITLPATTLSEVAALADQELIIRVALPPGYKLNVTFGTAVAAGYSATTVGGKY
jgi:hypothetical protein